jgi:hypothetical protein
MRNIAAAVFLACAFLGAGVLVACVDISTSTGNGSGSGTSGTAGTSSTSSVTETADAAVGVQGTGCSPIQDLGINLCTSTTSCPSVIVDPEQFPGCGWRIVNGVADLQCDCNGLMCPIGTPTTCAQAASLLQNQTQLIVCQQLGEGRCVPAVAPPAASSSSSSSGGGGGSCDQNCAADCSNNPSCLAMCGC